MRLYPPGMMMSKRCAKPYEMPRLPGQKSPFVCQPGTTIMIPVYAIHMWVSLSIDCDHLNIFILTLGTKKSTQTRKPSIRIDSQRRSAETATRRRIYPLERVLGCVWESSLLIRKLNWQLPIWLRTMRLYWSRPRGDWRWIQLLWCSSQRRTWWSDSKLLRRCRNKYWIFW